MKRLLAVLILVMLSCGLAVAAESVYPGSKLVFDMNLTEQDFLPAIKKALPGAVGILKAKMPGAPEMGPQAAATWDEVANEVLAALQGLKAVSVSYYELPKPDAAKLMAFYAPRVGIGNDWRPVVRAENPKGQGSFRLYVKPDLEEMFVMGSFPKGYFMGRTVGKIDATKLAELAAKMIPQIMSTMQPMPQPVPEPAPEAVPVPAPEQPCEPAPEAAPAQ